jgi:hypothetical protein
MDSTKAILALLLGVILAFTVCSCSQARNSPVETKPDNIPESFGVDFGNRNVLGLYSAVIDPDAGSFTIEPVTRSADYHYPLSNHYYVLSIESYDFGPPFTADIKLSHPFPGSGIDGFDPRVIAVLHANPGVSMNYPGFGVTANNSLLLNPDGYTNIFDHPYSIGNINPFISYFKDLPNRIWASDGQTEETKTWELDISGFGGPIAYLLIVDVSTNFPDPPEVITDNCLEPAGFDGVWIEGLTADVGAISKLEVTVLSWPGRNATRVKIEVPDLFDGVMDLQFDHYGPDYSDPEYRQYVFSCTLENTNGISGEINYLIQAKTTQSDDAIYYEGTYTILDPVTVHHVPGLGINRKTFIDSGYAFVTENDPLNSGDQLHIIDISTPETASVVNSIPQANPMNVFVKDGYAYVVNWDDGMDIIDIDPPETAFVARTLDTLGQAHGIDGEGDYLYVANWDHGGELQIFDISDPLSASIVGSAYTLHHMSNVRVVNGYAYIGTDSYGIHIVDVDPVPDAHEVKHIEFGNYEAVWEIDVVGNYCYVANQANGLQIIDVSVPEDASVIKQVSSPCGFGVKVVDGYAYIADCTDGGLTIIDVEPVEDAYVVTEIDTPYNAWGLDVADGYVYINDYHDNLQIVRLD